MPDKHHDTTAIQPKNFKRMILESFGEHLSFKRGVLYTAGMVMFQPWRACRGYLDAHDPRVASPVKLILALSAILVILAYISPTTDMADAMQQSQDASSFAAADTPEKLAAAQKSQADAEQINNALGPFYNLVSEFPFIPFLITVPLFALVFKWAAFGKMPYFRALVFVGYCSAASSLWFTLPQYIAYWFFGASAFFAAFMNALTVISLAVMFVFFFFAYKNLQDRTVASSLLRTVLALIYCTLFFVVVAVSVAAAFLTFTGVGHAG
ncbi:MAG: hypothetical protein COB37_03190 [Kordiimonadales bacterium]|nr:MAG: hypothetical protein COB37_03190 [Kordiimonadales bacterium]